MTDHAPPPFPLLEEALEEAGGSVGASEAHGMACGMICARGLGNKAAWLDHVLAPGERDPDAMVLLDELLEETIRQLNDPELGFQPFLPDEDEPLKLRTVSLRRWAQGFLYGIGLGEIKGNAAMPEEAYGFLRDLLEISKADFDADEADEEDEGAYVEIVEYLRSGVLLINEYLNPVRPAPTRLQ